MSSRPPALRALAEDPPASGLVLDFDGVLSPIVRDPAQSVLPPATEATLARLARRLGLIAIVSGRPAERLARSISVPGIALFGSYGIERITDGTRQLDPAARRWEDPVLEAGRELTAALGGQPGVLVERKPISAAVHWRQAPDTDAAGAAVHEVMTRVARDTGLRLEGGKLSEELRPPIDVDKGTALTALVAGKDLEAVAYAGDDLGDLPALRAVRAAGGYAIVVDHGAETDPRLLEVADQVCAGTDGFAAWLSDLADAAGA